MTSVRLSRMNLLAMVLALLAALALIEHGGLATRPGALLVTLTFWTGLLQGAVATVAIADLIGARWVRFLRREMLAAAPLLWLTPLLFLLFAGLQLDAYPWSSAPNAWLNAPFFLGRGLLLTIACALLAWAFARQSLANAPNNQRWAVLYLFGFVLCQSLVAYDWVMPLEYPWFSTLFGPFFAVEAIYAAFALAAALFCLALPQKTNEDMEQAPKRLHDLGTLLYGFSVLWGGLFFAQYLLIWYGNLPEEVGYLVTRTSEPFRLMAGGMVGFLFALPFLLLTPGANKGRPAPLLLAAASIVWGLFTEKALYVLPVVPFDRGILFLENGLLLALLLLTVHSRDRLLPTVR